MSRPASAADDLHSALENRLGLPGVLRVSGVPLVRRMDKETGSQRPTSDIVQDIEAAVANQGLCIALQPPIPTRITEGLDVVFVEASDVTVVVMEQPGLNGFAADAYSLAEDIMRGLHWQMFAMLAHPLQLRADGPVTPDSNGSMRSLYIHFIATFGYAPAED